MVFASIRDPLLVLDSDLRVRLANRSFYHVFGVDAQQTIGSRIYELGNGQWDIPLLRKLLDRMDAAHSIFDEYEVALEFPKIGPRTMLLNARLIEQEAPADRLVLLAI